MSDPPRRVPAVLCSRNAHKARELARILTVFELGLLDAAEFPAEEGESYYENARAKARFGLVAGRAEAWMIGEDSGLEVAGLGGRPGLRSARYAPEGAEANARVLAELESVAGEGRRARYVCDLVCLSPAGEEFRGTGALAGRIAEAPRGSEGFGYDPIFVPQGETRTLAELGNEWKAQSSHRARAARALLRALAGKVL